MCVICVQEIADAQEELQDPSTPVRLREGLGGNVQLYESAIQTCQQEIKGIDADLRVQRSALQGESCPRAIGHESHAFLQLFLPQRMELSVAV